MWVSQVSVGPCITGLPITPLCVWCTGRCVHMCMRRMCFPSQARRGRPSLGRGALGWDVAPAEGWRGDDLEWGWIAAVAGPERDPEPAGCSESLGWALGQKSLCLGPRLGLSPLHASSGSEVEGSGSPRGSGVRSGRAQGRWAVGPAVSVVFGSPLAAVIQAQHSGQITCTRLIP